MKDKDIKDKTIHVRVGTEEVEVVGKIGDRLLGTKFTIVEGLSNQENNAIQRVSNSINVIEERGDDFFNQLIEEEKKCGLERSQKFCPQNLPENPSVDKYPRTREVIDGPITDSHR